MHWSCRISTLLTDRPFCAVAQKEAQAATSHLPLLGEAQGTTSRRARRAPALLRRATRRWSANRIVPCAALLRALLLGEPTAQPVCLHATGRQLPCQSGKKLIVVLSEGQTTIVDGAKLGCSECLLLTSVAVLHNNFILHIVDGSQTVHAKLLEVNGNHRGSAHPTALLSLTLEEVAQRGPCREIAILQRHGRGDSTEECEMAENRFFHLSLLRPLSKHRLHVP
mmetsp:Transcript_4207/g.9081  ORF Transcript_4207/g.9081 Transcript_4207/m.9081 type:complete len:224 (+) Transcript_4207:101-772(+)